ncbi:MAG: DEAD/DEAH box helicase [Crocosphaera sp.]|nr:DEAD/DEAH box helicase [Crocosphaera sp.]
MIATAVQPPVIQLRPYQQQFITDVYRKIKERHGRILGVAPTGAGKTIISSQIVSDAVSRIRRVLFVVHRDILVQQTYDKFAKFGLECGFIKSGWEENKQALVQIASVQTMESRDWWQEWPVDVTILDECHITAFSSVIRKMITKIHPSALYLGITATPWRLNPKENMGDIFSSLVCAPMPNELINQGYLVKPSYFGADLAQNTTITIDEDGDYNNKALAIAYDHPEMIAEGLRNWQRLANGRRTIVFAVNVAHSQHICEAFNQAGIPAAHVDGRTSLKKRRKIYQQLADGEILVLCSCMALTEGFDVGAVEVAVLWRKTLSQSLYTQMVGRILRLSPETGKTDCLVIDLVGNVEKHGFIEDIDHDSIQLFQEPRRKRDAPSPSKNCPVSEGGCGAILYGFQMVCPHCKYNFEVNRIVKTLNLKHKLRPEDAERFQKYRDLLQRAYHLQRAPTWAAMTFKDQYGHFPPMAWGRHAVFGKPPPDNAKQDYSRHLQAIANRLNKDDQWIERYLSMEF